MDRPDFQARVSAVFGCLQHSLKESIDYPQNPDPNERCYPLKDFPDDSLDSAKRVARSRAGSKHKRNDPSVSKRHPRKWIKYSLSEDGSEQYKGLSGDQINKKAALEFLSGLKIKHQSKGADELSDSELTPSSKIKTQDIRDTNKRGNDDNEQPITFKPRFSKKPTKQRVAIPQDESDKNDDGRFVGSVYIMPEYTFGSQMRKRNKIKSTTQQKSTPQPNDMIKCSISLDHLEEQ